jgi:hypothetical protein
MVAAFGGLVYVDRETNRVMRLTYAPEGIPANWPVAGTAGVLEYGFAEIGGQEFLLPLQAEMRVLMRRGAQSRNVMEFGKLSQVLQRGDRQLREALMETLFACLIALQFLVVTAHDWVDIRGWAMALKFSRSSAAASFGSRPL